MDGKDQRVKKLPVLGIERAVDENVLSVMTTCLALPFFLPMPPNLRNSRPGRSISVRGRRCFWRAAGTSIEQDRRRAVSKTNILKAGRIAPEGGQDRPGGGDCAVSLPSEMGT